MNSNIDELFERRKNIYNETIKIGRPVSDRKKEDKAYSKITISVSENEKKKIQELADKEFYNKGNISAFIKKILIENNII